MTSATQSPAGRRLALTVGAAAASVDAPHVTARADTVGTLDTAVVTSATMDGVRFTVLRDGLEIVNTDTGTTAYAATWGAPAFYRFLAPVPRNVP